MPEPTDAHLECLNCGSPMVWNDQGDLICTGASCTNPKPRL
jgi:hypothetical protein